MALRLHDTLTSQLTPFATSEPGHARLYVCGPTVYDYPHLGHMRVNVVYDVLVRHLLASGLRVTYVRNVTDIDDKIIQRAAQAGEDPFALAARFTEAYREDTERLFCLPPTVEPKVSEHLPEILALIEKLVAQGNAYVEGQDVYFSVESFDQYGKLSHRKLTDASLGASGRVGDAETRKKKHPADFALWKSAKPGEPAWDSPWGKGRPGWHIECSAMCMRHLGESCDLHGGGLDLVFPHHENEIAQSEAATGKPLSRLWVHNGFIEINKEKMSKSLGNFFTARECYRLLEPEALRYFMLTTHYRAPLSLDFDVDAAGQVTGFPQIEECEHRVEYLYATRRRIAAIAPERIDAQGAADPALDTFPAQLTQALDDDLNMPVALAAVSELLKRANDAADAASRKKGKVSRAVLTSLGKNFAHVGAVLGLGLDDAAALLARIRTRRAHEKGLSEATIEAQIEARLRARAERDFARADAIRDELLGSGVELMDSPEGTTWRLT